MHILQRYSLLAKLIGGLLGIAPGLKLDESKSREMLGAKPPRRIPASRGSSRQGGITEPPDPEFVSCADSFQVD